MKLKQKYLSSLNMADLIKIIEPMVKQHRINKGYIKVCPGCKKTNETGAKFSNYQTYCNKCRTKQNKSPAKK